MSFFEPPPLGREPEFEEPKPPEWAGPPDNVLGTPVPLRVVVARSDEVVVAVHGVVAYATGVELTLSVRRRTQPEWFEDPFGHHLGARFRGAEADVLRFGVQLADGRKATTLDSPFPPRRDSTPDEPVLAQRGGGGGGRRWDFDFWLWPLPPPGSLAFVCEWAAEGIGETRVEVDAGPIREAGDRAETLWDEPSRAGGAAATWQGTIATGEQRPPRLASERPSSGQGRAEEPPAAS